PRRPILPRQPQIGLVDQRRRLESMTLPLALQEVSREPPHLVIDERDQTAQRLAVAALHFGQQQGHFAGRIRHCETILTSNLFRFGPVFGALTRSGPDTFLPGPARFPAGRAFFLKRHETNHCYRSICRCDSALIRSAPMAPANLDFEAGGTAGAVPRNRTTFTSPAGLAFRAGLTTSGCLQ